MVNSHAISFNKLEAYSAQRFIQHYKRVSRYYGENTMNTPVVKLRFIFKIVLQWQHFHCLDCAIVIATVTGNISVGSCS